MTYVREQTSAQLRAHMRALQKMPGWHNPLDDRLFSEVEAQDAKIERLLAALERGTYYINRLEAAQRGHVVRDLDEACNAWEAYQARCALEQRGNENG